MEQEEGQYGARMCVKYTLNQVLTYGNTVQFSLPRSSLPQTQN